jgi:hypothetical protein
MSPFQPLTKFPTELPIPAGEQYSHDYLILLVFDLCIGLLLGRQQSVSLSGKSPASPTIK